jgi:hypothetical protein
VRETTTHPPYESGVIAQRPQHGMQYATHTWMSRASEPPKTANEALQLPIFENVPGGEGMCNSILTVTNPANGFVNEFLVRDGDEIHRVEHHPEMGWVRVPIVLIPEKWQK